MPTKLNTLPLATVYVSPAAVANDHDIPADLLDLMFEMSGDDVGDMDDCTFRLALLLNPNTSRETVAALARWFTRMQELPFSNVVRDLIYCHPNGNRNSFTPLPAGLREDRTMTAERFYEENAPAIRFVLTGFEVAGAAQKR